MINIGLIISPFLTEELIKEELIEIQDNNKLLEEINKKYQISNNGKIYTTNEIIIINYIRNTYEDVNVNIIDPLEINSVGENDIIFLLTFDIIEAFHTLPYYKYKEYANYLMKQKNIYPHYDFQKLINFKDSYFNHLIKNNINVLDFFIIKKNDDYKKKINELFDYKDKVGWGNFIIKPLYGQEGIGFKAFNENASSYLVEKDIEHLIKMGFPGVIFQEELRNYDTNSEFRTYFINGEYIYTVETGDHVMELVNTHNNKANTKITKIIKFAQRVVNSLPHVIINNVKLPHLLIRVDIGYDNDNNLFVNEIEFVPSLYTNFIHKKKMAELNLHELLGDTIYEITAKYVNNRSILYDNKPNAHMFNIIIINIFIILIVLFFLYTH
jgi:hypothetical protein